MRLTLAISIQNLSICKWWGVEAWFFVGGLLNDESYDIFQNIEANNPKYQVIEANLTEATYFLSIDLPI